jgi:hypothetical protein
MRWGVAWSFKHSLQNFKDHHKSQKITKTVLSHTINSQNFNETVERIQEIFKNLQINVESIGNQHSNCLRWELSAAKNTWSNQRKQRRAQLNNRESKEVSDNQETLKIGFELRKENENARIQMYFISGSMNKDCVNQILQFIKNKVN